MATDMPHSIEAEQAVLGTLLLTGDAGADAAWHRVSGRLTADDFHRADHRLIHGGIERLASIGAAHDVVCVADRLAGDDGDVLERVGGLLYLTDLAHNATGMNIVAYAGIVREKARLRAIAKVGTEAAALARAGSASADDVAARMRSMLDALPVSGAAEGWPVVSAGELLSEEDESLEWLVHELLPAGGTSLLFGAPKTGKSSLARMVATKVVIGAPWLGYHTMSGPVLYAALDERRATVREHIRTLVDGNAPHDADTLRERLHVVFGPRPPGGVSALRAVIERIEPRPVLVVIDTLMKLEPFEDANDYGLSGLSMARVTALAHDTGSHVMLVHHARKDRTGDADLASAALGSTRIGADVDVLARVTVRNSDKQRLVSFVGRDGVSVENLDVTFAALHGGANRPAGAWNPIL